VRPKTPKKSKIRWGIIMYSVGLAYLLWLFSGFGALGFHRFYLGKIPSGVLWMFTGGLLGIGSLFDFFTLPGQVRQANIEKAIMDGSFRPNNNQLPNPNNGHTRLISQSNSTEHYILKIAKENKGILTASELALAAKISVEEAKKALETMVSRGYAELRVRQSGTLVYAIPDLMNTDDPLVI